MDEAPSDHLDVPPPHGSLQAWMLRTLALPSARGESAQQAGPASPAPTPQSEDRQVADPTSDAVSELAIATGASAPRAVQPVTAGRGGPSTGLALARISLGVVIAAAVALGVIEGTQLSQVAGGEVAAAPAPGDGGAVIGAPESPGTAPGNAEPGAAAAAAGAAGAKYTLVGLACGLPGAAAGVIGPPAPAGTAKSPGAAAAPPAAPAAPGPQPVPPHQLPPPNPPLPAPPVQLPPPPLPLPPPPALLPPLVPLVPAL